MKISFLFWYFEFFVVFFSLSSCELHTHTHTRIHRIITHTPTGTTLRGVVVKQTNTPTHPVQAHIYYHHYTTTNMDSVIVTSTRTKVKKESDDELKSKKSVLTRESHSSRTKNSDDYHKPVDKYDDGYNTYDNYNYTYDEYNKYDDYDGYNNYRSDDGSSLQSPYSSPSGCISE